MKEKIITAIITRLLQLAKDEGAPVGAVRITKLLYILDLECFRRHRYTLTELNWIYYKYGPYAYELEDILSTRFHIREQELPGKRILREVKLTGYGQEVEETLDFEAKTILNKIWQQWGTESLGKLLDYVYFETEPMENPVRGKPLDFTQVVPEEKSIKLVWSTEEKMKLRILGSQIRERLRKISIPERHPYPKEVAEILKIWDEDEVTDLHSLHGKVGMDSSDLGDKNNGTKRN